MVRSAFARRRRDDIFNLCDAFIFKRGIEHHARARERLFVDDVSERICPSIFHFVPLGIAFCQWPTGCGGSFVECTLVTNCVSPLTHSIGGWRKECVKRKSQNSMSENTSKHGEPTDGMMCLCTMEDITNEDKNYGKRNCQTFPHVYLKQNRGATHLFSVFFSLIFQWNTSVFHPSSGSQHCTKCQSSSSSSIPHFNPMLIKSNRRTVKQNYDDCWPLDRPFIFQTNTLSH